jgi:hypothetical protein
MNNTKTTRPSLRLTSAASATEIVPPPDPKAVRRTIYALEGALFGASVRLRDMAYADDMPARLEAVAAEIRRVSEEADHLLTLLGR